MAEVSWRRMAVALLGVVLACTVDLAEVPRGPVAPHVEKGGQLLRQVTPEYPLEAKRLRVVGVVMLRAVVELDGSVVGIEAISRPHPLLEEAAVAALRQWLFKPRTVNGFRIRSRLDVRFEFKKEPAAARACRRGKGVTP